MLLCSGDWHLTDLPRDAYRWNFVAELPALLKKHKITTLVVLGDLTDAKDRHNAELVNKVVAAFHAIYKTGVRVVFLQGNHDYLDDKTPFFRFLGKLPGVKVVTSSYQFEDGGAFYLALGHTRRPEEAWKGLDFSRYDAVFGHQTFSGAVAETGTMLSGLPLSLIKGARHFYSGDIHAPQTIGKLCTYVGAPYHVRFGDGFDPRVIVLDGQKATSVPVPGPSRRNISVTSVADLDGVELNAGDQVKIKVITKAVDEKEWELLRGRLKRLVEKRGVEVVSILPYVSATPVVGEKLTKVVSPEDKVKAYAKAKKLDEVLGLSFLGSRR